MRTIDRRLLGVLLSCALAPFALAACSLASGVSDLQGGAAAKAEAGTNDASVATDDAGDAGGAEGSVALDTGAPPGDGILCGASRCQFGDSCCVNLEARTAACAEGSHCSGNTMIFDCGRTTDCTASDERNVCCWAPVDNGSTCARRCDGPANKVLCDPNDPEPCPDGMTCAPDTLLSPYMSCR